MNEAQQEAYWIEQQKLLALWYYYNVLNMPYDENINNLNVKEIVDEIDRINIENRMQNAKLHWIGADGKHYFV